MREEVRNLSTQGMKERIMHFKEKAFKDAFARLEEEKNLDELFLITRYVAPQSSNEDSYKEKTAEFHANVSLTQVNLNDLAFSTEQFKLNKTKSSVTLLNVILDREYALKILGSLDYKKEQLETAKKYESLAVTDEQKGHANYMLIGIRDTCKYASNLAVKEMKTFGVK